MKNSNIKAILIDGYLDEPSCLGVPPYISPHIRYTYGALLEAGIKQKNIDYKTIDSLRGNWQQNLENLENYDLLVLIAGTTVPGRYLGGRPISIKEIEELSKKVYYPSKVLGGPITLVKNDFNNFDKICNEIAALDIYQTLTEKINNLNSEKIASLISKWAISGAEVTRKHPNYPELMIELETFRGCPRASGHCTFCSERLKKRTYQRPPEDIIKEVKKLSSLGNHYYRLGCQTDLLLYQYINNKGKSYEYYKIRNKWLGPDKGQFFTKEQLWNIALFGFLPLLFIAVLAWIVLLRREVRNRTKQLNKEIEEHKASLDELYTKQKQLTESEEHIRLLLNSTAEGIYGINLNGECTFMNTSALMMLGFHSTDEVMGKNMHNLIHHTKEDGTSYSIEKCLIFKALKESQGTFSDKEVFWQKNGTSFPVEYYSYPIVQNNEVTGAVVTFLDITEKKKAQDELIQLKDDLEKLVAERTTELQEKVQKLNKSQKAMLYMVEDLNKMTVSLKEERKKLEDSNKELEAFAYSISHDLRAPLRAINGYSAFLKEDYSNELGQEGARYIQVIRENASKMDILITDLLNLSRVSRSDLNYVMVDMAETAKSIFQEISTEKEQKDFDIQISEVPKAKCDLRLIKLVWQNLLENALKYSANSKTKKIEIDAQEKEQEIIYSVKDFGAGFNEKYKDKLFGVFQRLHRENEFKGTGVGLAVVQRIIHRHGGKVWAEGKQNEGATFYFSLLK